jgi:alanyl-tRNA synthetase
VVAAAAAPEPAVVVARAKALGLDLRSLVPELQAHSRGRGGGSPDMLQFAPADAAACEEAFAWAAAALPAVLDARR